MEKEHHQPDSIATVTIKPDYAPSEIYSNSEPPPAYMKNVYASVQVAKIIATTVVLCSVILGFFLLASAYVTANASCKQLEQELELLGEVADRFQPPLQPEALIQENPNENEKQLKGEESKISSKSNEIDNEDEEDGGKKLHFKLPLQLDFDDIAGALIEKNQKSKMNCVVEKKRAEQLVDHQSKVVALPFGLNLTTDPRLEKITGERMAIFCESGTAQRAEKEESDENDDEEQNEATIMIQPVMIPIPPSRFQTHMSQQAMLPPHPQPQIHVQEHIMIQPQHPHQMPPQPFARFPPHPMETMRPPMPPTQQIPNDFPPANVLKQIAEQIVAQKEREDMMQQQQQQHQQQRTRESEERIRFPMPENMVTQMRIPMPEMILNQLNRLQSNRGEVIVAVAEQDQPTPNSSSDSEEQSQEQEQRPTEIRVVQEQKINQADMNGRQSYARTMPIDIPEQMMKQEQEQQEPEAQATEEMRPHYVQPRSIRTRRAVETLTLKSSKRVKRCNCDCSC